MATKKESRSSKTDHVLHLLSGIIPEQEETDLEATSFSPSTYTGEVSQRRAAPILEVAHTNHEALSESIRQALEQQLNQELALSENNSPKPEAVPPHLDHPVDEPATASHSPVSSDQTSDVEPSDSTSLNPYSISGIQELPDGLVQIDVMSILVAEQLEHYQKIFHLCECSRCRADVQSLALSQLPAKYVVLEKEKVFSMLGLYRARLGTEVSIALTKACDTVKNHPRHI